VYLHRDSRLSKESNRDSNLSRVYRKDPSRVYLRATLPSRVYLRVILLNRDFQALKALLSWDNSRDHFLHRGFLKATRLSKEFLKAIRLHKDSRLKVFHLSKESLKVFHLNKHFHRDIPNKGSLHSESLKDSHLSKCILPKFMVAKRDFLRVT
jgi:hypothetical protein